MAEKKRIFKLAEEIKVEAQDIIAYLKTQNPRRVSAASSVDAETAQDIKDQFSGKKRKPKKTTKPKISSPAIEKPDVSSSKITSATENLVPSESKPAKKSHISLEKSTKATSKKTAGSDPAPPPIESSQDLATQPTEDSTNHEVIASKTSSNQLEKTTEKEPESKVPQKSEKGLDLETSSSPLDNKVAATERTTSSETIRQHLSRSGQIHPRPFQFRSRQTSTARTPGFGSVNKAQTNLSNLRQPTLPSPRPPTALPGPPGKNNRRTKPGHHQIPTTDRHKIEEGRIRGTRSTGIEPPEAFQPIPINRSVTLTEGVTIKELSEKLEIKAKDVIKRLLDKGIFATMNQTLDETLVKDISADFGAEASIISFEEDAEYEAIADEKSENITPRPPVITIMGHVDHGKTSLLDALRETDVVSQESGGITQHIGAYQVEQDQRMITFIDTPGHEAFTLMRARGAKVTDIVVLVVAADDGVMPQTLEAINHSRAAKAPIIVAINKIDRPNAQVDKVKKALSDNGLTPEDWGGDTVTVEVSATEKTNLGLLLEMILLVTDLQGFKANPHRTAVGTIVEAKLDRGRGPVATVLVQNGTLSVGDSFIVGAVTGKVRALFNHNGQPVLSAEPSMPVEVLGIQEVPEAGDLFQVLTDVNRIKQIGNLRQRQLRERKLSKTARLTLEHLHEQLSIGIIKELPLIIKADFQGSVEVVSETLAKLSNEKVKVKIIHGGPGAITETDILLAAASNAIIVGFNVRPEKKALALANQEGVDIRLHTIIYNISNEIKNAMLGLLEPTFKEIWQGTAEVRETFKVPKAGTVAGCYISDGKISRSSQVRLLRDNVVTYEGKIASLRRFKDDASEVRSGLECGIGLEKFNDIKNNDVIEAFLLEKVAPQLD